jgi:hypothetical protein
MHRAFRIYVVAKAPSFEHDPEHSDTVYVDPATGGLALTCIVHTLQSPSGVTNQSGAARLI